MHLANVGDLHQDWSEHIDPMVPYLPDRDRIPTDHGCHGSRDRSTP